MCDICISSIWLEWIWEWQVQYDVDETLWGGWSTLIGRVMKRWDDGGSRNWSLNLIIRVHRDVEDRVIWTVSRYGPLTFLVKSLYSILEPRDSPLFHSGSIWKSSAPPKVAFFAWEVSWGKVLILDQLQRRGYFLANRCFLCLYEVETVDHLLHCANSSSLESSFLPLWCVLDSFLFSEENSSWVAWVVCG